MAPPDHTRTERTSRNAVVGRLGEAPRAARLPFTRLPVYPFTRLPVYPFTRMLHLLTVLALALAIAAMCWIGRRVRGTPNERRYGLVLSVSVWALWFGYQGYDIATRGFGPSHGLPLPLSDV